MTTFDFNIGANVHAKDGQCGKLAKVVIDPESLQVTNLIVEEGFLAKTAHVFPIDIVDHTSTDDIYLTVNSDDRINYPEYKETEFQRPAAGWQEHSGYRLHEVRFPSYGPPYDVGIATIREKVHHGVSADFEVVKQGTPIANAEGIIGRLDHVVTNTNGDGTEEEGNDITHLVVRQGLLFPSFVEIPISFVKSVSQEQIFLTVTNDELKQFFNSKTEEEDGDTYTTNGTESILSPETELASQITSTLISDPRIQSTAVEAINDRGVITLTGLVENQKSRQIAESIAAHHPNVVSVVNNLRITH